MISRAKRLNPHGEEARKRRLEPCRPPLLHLGFHPRDAAPRLLRMSRTENFGAEDEGLFISIASPHAIGKKWNIAASETFSWLPATGGTNAENVDYRFNRAA